MKLIRFGEKGREKPGLLQADGIVDLRACLPDIPDVDAGFFEGKWLEKIARLRESGVQLEVRIGSPVIRPSKIICLGNNYAEHAREGNFERPQNPVIFPKASSALNGPFDPIILPLSSRKVDWEVELALVIGRRGKRVAAADAWDYVAGVTVMNDVSGRDVQFADGQWYRGKSFDTFAPLGPVLVTLDEIEDAGNLELTTLVDGRVMQQGNTGDMIFSPAEIIEFVSRDITLLPGDIISTGTPSGVGIFRDPPVLLEAGNVVECRIQGIGAIVNWVTHGS